MEECDRRKQRSPRKIFLNYLRFKHTKLPLVIISVFIVGESKSGWLIINWEQCNCKNQLERK